MASTEECPPAALSWHQRYYLQHKEKIKARACAHRRTAKGKAYVLKHELENYKNPQRKAYRCAVASLSHILSGKLRGTRSSRYLDALGCSPQEFRTHLERQFLPGMTWENHGIRRGQWQVDHIRSGSSFDLTDPVQFAEYYHFSNTRPLWGFDNNSRKNAK